MLDLNTKHDLKEKMNQSINAMIDALAMIDDGYYGSAMDLWTSAIQHAKRTTAEIAKAKFAGNIQ